MTPADRIELRDLRVTAVVGVLPEERNRAQPLSVDVSVEVDLSAAGLSDALEDTVDYAAVCDAVSRVLQSAAPQLLERLATAAADEVLGLDDRIEAVDISVRKLRPPVPHALESSGVRLVRRSVAGRG